jgi:hypothetical protein
MRYSIMLQLVGLITLALVGTAALFAWLQNRPLPNQTSESATDSHQERTEERLSFKRSIA